MNKQENGEIMIFALILAGGLETANENETPRPFLELGNKPILIQTIEKFYIISDFDEIIVLTSKDWINYTKEIIDSYIPKNNIQVIESGLLRIDSINNGMEYIINNYGLEDHIIITHDAVRPFVTYEIIKENIEKVKEFGACNTIIPATDTIVESKNSEIISEIPNRNYMYQGQTPQSFKLKKLKEFYDNLNDGEKDKLTDACKLFVLNNETVAIVHGERSNMKITYDYDLKLANKLL